MEKFKLYFLNNKRIFITIGCFLAIILCCLGCFLYYHTQTNSTVNEFEFNDLENNINNENFDNQNDIENDNDLNIDDDKQNNSLNNSIDEIKKEELIEYIYVDIKGYVNKPGVYKFEINGDKRIHDLISLAGGLKKDADTSIINLSTKLKDEMVVIIYSKKQVEDFVKTKEKLSNKIEICDKEEIKNDACICDDDINNNFENNFSNENTSDKVDNNQNNSSTNSEINSKININTASLELLMSLSGIGESKAKAIIDYRNEVGLFKTIEDIKNVSGIGDSAFEKIKDSITV